MLGSSGVKLCHIRQQVSCVNNSLVRTVWDDSGVPKIRFNRTKPPSRERNHDYYHNYHQIGQRLPRMKESMLSTPAPSYKPEDQWSKENALLGQNDYIDLLGDGSVHPAQLLYHVPRWLRGFPGNHKANELVRAIHYRNMYDQKMKRNMPKSYHELGKRIDYLLKRHNYYKSDEIRLERKGLHDEQPDYEYKHPWNKRWFKHFNDYYV